MNALGALVRTEARLVSRDTAGLVIPFGLPLLILVMNGLGADAPGQAPVGGAQDVVIVPVTLALVVAMIALVNMPAVLASYRTTGVLRRLSVTPAHPATVLLAQVLVSLAQAAVGIALALGVAVVAFGVRAPANLSAALLTLVLTVLAMYALGMLVAAIAPSMNGAIAIGIVLFFAMTALSGGFGPVDNLPAPLPTVGEHSPFGAGVAGLAASWQGAGPQPGPVVALGGTALAAGVAAVRLFRWD